MEPRRRWCIVRFYQGLRVRNRIIQCKFCR
uniref:Uncharacterized protein n=1 Tax=Musa acuminata subsp. malaccensis TaxID=214687 RepID=A0A804HX10_MUSAM